MNDEALAAAVDRFLKSVSLSAKRELEKAFRHGLASGKLKIGEPTTTSITLSNAKADLDITIFSKVEL
jgi:hypothetical protein